MQYKYKFNSQIKVITIMRESLYAYIRQIYILIFVITQIVKLICIALLGWKLDIKVHFTLGIWAQANTVCFRDITSCNFPIFKRFDDFILHCSVNTYDLGINTINFFAVRSVPIVK